MRSGGAAAAKRGGWRYLAKNGANGAAYAGMATAAAIIGNMAAATAAA